MTARSTCGRSVVDDDDEIDRLLAGCDLPNTPGDVPHECVGPALTDLDELEDWQ